MTTPSQAGPAVPAAAPGDPRGIARARCEIRVREHADPGCVEDIMAAADDYAAAAEALQIQATDHQAEQADEFVNELLANAPEQFDGDESAEYITASTATVTCRSST